MYFSSLIRTKILLPWEAPVQWYLKCIIRYMLFICVLMYGLWSPSYLMLYTTWMLLSERQHFSCVNMYFYLWICIIILYLVLSACMPATYIYVRMCPYTRVCYPQKCVHTYMDFARVYVSCFHMLVQFVYVCVCASIWDGMCAIL